MSARPPISTRLRIVQISVLTIVSLVSFGALTYPIGLRSSTETLNVGDVNQNTKFAPQDVSYVSEFRTQEAILAAEAAVAPVYTSPDPAIARQQIERMTTTMQVITSIRDDAQMSPEEKKSSLVNLSDVRLQLDTVDYILLLSESRWQIVQAESLRVLELVMRRSIHEEDVEQVKANVTSSVSLTLNELQSTLVSELVAAFIVPNSFYSEELTQAARKAARESIQPVVKTYKAGETVVPAGRIITPADMEAFQQLGMISPGQRIEDMIGAASLILLSVIFVSLYFMRRKRTLILNDARNLIVIALIFIVFLLGARLLTGRTLLPYAYPLQAAGLLLTALFGFEVGLIIAIPLCLIAAYGLQNSLDLGSYYLISSLIGVLVLGYARRFWGFMSAGVAIAISGLGVLAAYYFPFIPLDLLGVAQLIGAVIFCGFSAASITLLLQYLFAQALGLTTALQLLDIARPDSPLLQFFLRTAPGTYQHSLQVANLAEQAAEKIGADPLVTRVGAQFHDIGKALNPTFFIENQVPGNVNKHHDISPQESAATIIRHVTDGIQLAKKYRLPRRMHDFILEHHGTLITRYQYNQAMEAAQGDVTKVNIEDFRYPGPRPHSRETALLMLADATEARARAERPLSDDDLRALVRNVIDTVQKFGQLDDTLLTLRDLNLITESFVTTLRGTYHPRIQYPNASVPDQDSTILTPRKENKQP
jgi:putative nucleotidyltransferase with HDIG domain